MNRKHILNTSLCPRRITRRGFLKLAVTGLLAGCRSSTRATPTNLPTTSPRSTPTATTTPTAEALGIRLSDIVFTNPHYNFLDTRIYDDYGADMIGWGFLPAAQGSFDTSNYIKAVEQHHSAGIKFQARIEWDVVWDGMRKFTSDYERAACRDLNGEPLNFPWKPSAYWFCSHQTLFRDYILYQINMALTGSPDSLMFDSQTSTPITYWYGGCFCDRCMVDFNDWLNEHYTSDELASMGIPDLATFNYHDYLVDAGYTRTTYNNAAKRWPNNIPLSQEYRLFQLQFINSYVQELANYARNKVDYPLMISTSSPIIDPYFHGSRMVYVPDVDFYTLEYNHNADRHIVPENVITLYKIADALGRPCVVTGQPNPDWLTMYREKRVNLARSWIAQAYANGAIFMVPIKMWAYEGSKHYWYNSRTGDYDYIYRFIHENPDLFDGYEPISHVGLVYVHTAYRKNSKVIFDACAALTRENIPFRLVIAGDDWWPRHLDQRELDSLDVVTTSDTKYLDPAQQAVLDTVSDRIIQWSDLTSLFDLLPREITIEASDVTVLPRAKPNDPSAPLICHLVNRNYIASTDSMIVQKNFAVTLTDSLFGSPITRATYYEPGESPVALKVKSVSNGILINIPHLEHWGVLQLG